MQDRADRAVRVPERRARASLREAADADDEPRPEVSDDLPQRVVACGKQRRLLRGRQLVGRAVAARLLDERERAVIRDEEACEEPLRRAVPVACPPPESCAADLAPLAGEALDRSLRMLLRRPLDSAG